MPYSYDRTTATRLAKWHVENGKLKCDMEAHCTEPVTHIDQYGFLYCTGHAESVSRRKTRVRPRRITPSDIKKLLQGNPELVGRTAAWKPWSDPTWHDEGFKTSLEVDGQNVGYATMSKPKGDSWLCRVYFGGGAPIVTGKGKVPAQAAADARQKLERSIEVLR